MSHISNTNQLPLVSVIIPVYNVEKYLEQCLVSVVYSSYQNLEIIIVDDGSPDDSKRIYDKYAAIDQRIKIIKQSNGGLSLARNNGIKAAQGEYIHFLDSDDWVDLNFYEELVNDAMRYDADVVACGVKMSNGVVSIIYDNRIICVDLQTKIQKLQCGKYGYAIRYLIRRTLLIENKIDFVVGKYFEDLPFTLPLVKAANRIVINPNTYYHYNRRPGTITTSLKNRRKLRQWAYDFRNSFLKENKLPMSLLHEPKIKYKIYLFGFLPIGTKIVTSGGSRVAYKLFGLTIFFTRRKFLKKTISSSISIPSKEAHPPLISVIIPVYNVEKYLEQCLVSVVFNSYKNLEIIIVDDGSPDNSKLIYDKYAAMDQRIKIIKQSNGGVSLARNNGIRVAQGDYIHFLDGDDYIDLNFYEELVNDALQCDADMVACGLKYSNRKRSITYSQRSICVDLHTKTDKTQCTKYGGACRYLIRRDFLLKCEITFPVGIHCGEDVLFSLPLVKIANRVVINPNTFYHYVNHPGSLMSRNKKHQQQKQSAYDFRVSFLKENSLPMSLLEGEQLHYNIYLFGFIPIGKKVITWGGSRVVYRLFGINVFSSKRTVYGQ